MGKTIYKLFLEVFGDFLSVNGFKKKVVNDVYSKGKFSIYYKFNENHKLLKSIGFDVSRGTEVGWKTFDIFIGNDPLIENLENTNIFHGHSLANYCRIKLKREKLIPKSFSGNVYSPWQFKKDNDEETLSQLQDAYKAFEEHGKEYLLSNNFDIVYEGYKRLDLSYEYVAIDYAIFANDKTEALRIIDNRIRLNEESKKDPEARIKANMQSPNYTNKRSLEYRIVQSSQRYLKILNVRSEEHSNLKSKIENEFFEMQKQLHVNIDKNIALIKNIIE